MAAFDNPGISMIEMKIPVVAFCTLGLKGYSGTILVEFVPDEIIPDYLEIQDWVNKSVMDKHFTIEEIVIRVLDYLKSYEPSKLSVTLEVNNSAHFPVRVSAKHLVY